MKGKIVKSLIALCLVATMVMSSFAAVVSDDDSSAFVTKAEFEAIKNNYDNQIKGYLSSVDEKIDNTIANYLNNFAGGLGGKLKMNEKTAVYMHNLKITAIKGVTVPTPLEFNVLTTYKYNLTIADLYGDITVTAPKIENTKFGQWGIGWLNKGSLHPSYRCDEQPNLLYLDDFDKLDDSVQQSNIQIWAGRWCVEFEPINIAGTEIKNLGITIGGGWKQKMFIQSFATKTGGGTWWLFGSDLTLTDSVQLYSTNPVDVGANFAASGEMISKAQMNMGINQATYKHTIKITKYKGAEWSSSPSFDVYTTYAQPITRDFILTYRSPSKWGWEFTRALAQKGFSIPALPYGSYLRYEDKALDASGTFKDIWAAASGAQPTATVDGVTYKLNAIRGSVGIEHPVVYLTVAPVGGTQFYPDWADLEWTDTVTVASTNPITYNSKHFVTGALIGREVPFTLTLASGWTLEDSRAIILFDSLAFLQMRLSATTTMQANTEIPVCNVDTLRIDNRLPVQQQSLTAHHRTDTSAIGCGYANKLYINAIKAISASQEIEISGLLLLQ